MKIYADNPEDGVIIPNGNELPRRAPVGMLFKLNCDMEVTHTTNPWYGAGTYMFDHGGWVKVNDDRRQIRSAVIGPQTVLFEGPPLKARQPPRRTEGHLLGSLLLTPVSRAATYSGTATLWVEPELDCQLVLAVYRGTTLISMAVEAVSKGRPRTLCVSFFDMPFTGHQAGQALEVTYELTMHCDAVGAVAVNRGAQSFLYDEVAPSSAFTVSENK